MAEDKPRRYPLDENGRPDLADEWDLPEDWPKPEDNPYAVRPGEDHREVFNRMRTDGRREREAREAAERERAVKS
jgi:hypothetical protein